MVLELGLKRLPTEFQPQTRQRKRPRLALVGLGGGPGAKGAQSRGALAVVVCPESGSAAIVKS